MKTYLVLFLFCCVVTNSQQIGDTLFCYNIDIKNDIDWIEYVSGNETIEECFNKINFQKVKVVRHFGEYFEAKTIDDIQNWWWNDLNKIWIRKKEIFFGKVVLFRI